MSSALALTRSRLSAFRRRFLDKTSLLAGAFCVAAALSVSAQSPGDRDPSFLSAFSGGTIFSLFRYDFTDSDGNFDNFLAVGGDQLILGRLLPDGLQLPSDLATNPGNADLEAPANFGDGSRLIYTIAPDTANPGFFFVGGLFGKFNGQPFPKRNILRISPGFVIDPDFDPGQGADDYVTAILPTSDGRVVVGGLFQNFNQATHNHIACLTNNGVADGAFDLTFNQTLNIDNNVLALAEARDPVTGSLNTKILVGGLFNQINGRPATKLARLNQDGTLDTTFVPVIDERVNTIAVQPDGKVLIGGDFTLVNGVAVKHIARLNYDGSLDPTFAALVTDVTSDNVNVVAVNTIVLLPDGRMYVGGNFIKVNGITRNYLALLLPNGSVDLGFDPGENIINSVQVVLPDPSSSRVYVGETVSRKVNNIFPASLIALYGTTSFFAGQVSVGNGFDYLAFPNGNAFGYYSFLGTPGFIYHVDLGYEFVTNAIDSQGGIYLYDFQSGHTFYTSPNFPFPYLYDFNFDTGKTNIFGRGNIRFVLVLLSGSGQPWPVQHERYPLLLRLRHRANCHVLTAGGNHRSGGEEDRRSPLRVPRRPWAVSVIPC